MGLAGTASGPHMTRVMRTVVCHAQHFGCVRRGQGRRHAIGAVGRIRLHAHN